ncbi:MAG: serine hydrolase domain-containing protein [Saprospiraceae bacterium]
MRFFLYLFCVLAGIQCTGASGQAEVRRPITSPSLPPATNALLDDYTEFMRTEIMPEAPPGAAVAIVVDGEVVFADGFGVKEYNSADSVDAHTVFRIGSLSKGFAGVLTGILVQDSLLKWDSKVQEFYPEFSLRSRAQAGRISLRHILSHTTGLPYHAYTNLIERGKSIREINAYFPRVALQGKEGSIYSYQNAVFSVIEEVFKGACGKNYEALLRDRIFEPLQMEDASASFIDLQTAKNKALPHQGGGGFWRPVPISHTYYNACAAGGVNASASDMGRWLQLLMGEHKEIVRDQTLDEVFTPRVRTENERRFFRNWEGEKEAWYGYGWRILNLSGETLVYHGGYVNNYRGEIAFSRDHRIGVCVLFNGPTPLAKNCVPEFIHLCQKHGLFPDSKVPDNLTKTDK